MITTVLIKIILYIFTECERLNCTQDSVSFATDRSKAHLPFQTVETIKIETTLILLAKFNTVVALKITIQV